MQPVSRRVAYIRIIAVLAFLFGACSSSDEPADKCEQLVDHMVDLRARSAPEADRAAHAKAFRDAVGARLLSECQQLSPKQVECVLAASESGAVNQCVD